MGIEIAGGARETHQRPAGRVLNKQNVFLKKKNPGFPINNVRQLQTQAAQMISSGDTHINIYHKQIKLGFSLIHIACTKCISEAAKPFA